MVRVKYDLHVRCKKGPELSNTSLYFCVIMLQVGDNRRNPKLGILNDMFEYFHSTSHDQLKTYPLLVYDKKKNLSDRG